MEHYDFHLGLAQIASRPSSPAALVRSPGMIALGQKRYAKVPSIAQNIAETDTRKSPTFSEHSERSERAAAIERIRATITLEGGADEYTTRNLGKILAKRAEEHAEPVQIEPIPEPKKGLLRRMTNKLKGREEITKPSINKVNISLPLSVMEINPEIQGRELIDLMTANRLRFFNPAIRVEDAAGLKSNPNHEMVYGTNRGSDSDSSSFDAVESFAAFTPRSIYGARLIGSPPPAPTRPDFPARSKTVGHPDRDTTFSMFINASPASSEEEFPADQTIHAAYTKSFYQPHPSGVQSCDGTAEVPSYPDDYPQPLRIGRAL